MILYTLQVLFLQDPLGDIPWSEEEASKDVVHLDYQSFKRFVLETYFLFLILFNGLCGELISYF